MLVGPRGDNRRVATRQLVNAVAQLVSDAGALAQGSKANAGPPKSKKRKRSEKSGKASGKKIGAYGKNVVKKKKTKKSSKGKKSLGERVKALEQQKPHTATYDYRISAQSQAACTVSKCAYRSMFVADSAAIEASLDTLKYLNDAGAVVNVNVQNLDVRNEVRIVDLYSKIRLRNNFEISARVDVYGLVCKEATSLSPFNCIDNDDVNVGITDAPTNLLIYPSDFALFRQKYRIAAHEKFNLRSGDTAEVVYANPHRDYDAELRDVTQIYQKGDFVWFIRVQGGISHDASVATSIGTGDATIDINTFTKWKVKYPSQANFYFIETTDGLSNQGNGAVQAGPQLDPTYT